MRETSGQMRRVSNKVKATLVALLAMFAVGMFATASANAADGDGTLKLSFNDGKIAVLPELLGPIDAAPPADSPVTIQGSLAQNGAFSATADGFNFPTQQIALPTDPLINGILGDHVNIHLGATGSFSGTYDRSTGAFNSSIPLALTLEFSPPDNVLACRLPFNLAVNTTGTLTFPGAGEGGSDLSYAASPFAPPAGNGSVYGSWDPVKFADIEDGDGMPDWHDDPEATQAYCATLMGLVPALVPGWPAGLDGLAGEIWLAGKSTVTDPAPDKCRDDQTGTPPNCVDKNCPSGQVGTPPNCHTQSAAKPVVSITKKATVKAGKKVKIKVTVKNAGEQTLTGKVTIKSSNKKVTAAPKSISVNLAGGKSITKTITVKAAKKAKGKANITAAIAGKSAKSKVTVKVAKKKKKKK